MVLTCDTLLTLVEGAVGFPPTRAYCGSFVLLLRAVQTARSQSRAFYTFRVTNQSDNRAVVGTVIGSRRCSIWSIQGRVSINIVFHLHDIRALELLGVALRLRTVNGRYASRSDTGISTHHQEVKAGGSLGELTTDPTLPPTLPSIALFEEPLLP